LLPWWFFPVAFLQFEKILYCVAFCYSNPRKIEKKTITTKTFEQNCFTWKISYQLWTTNYNPIQR
jgi:hypothetical protein